ncbi:hypothetical protein AAVH_13054 [Aphelenchoides avenae]|nr:hypothetical protein AAVH_13054 [Aphelenchus avenae]
MHSIPIYQSLKLNTWRLDRRTICKKPKEESKKKVVNLPIQVRKQVLPLDMLVDVLNCIDRITLDINCQRVSRRLCASLEKTKPLRPVDEARFEYDDEKDHFLVTFKSTRYLSQGRNWRDTVKCREFKSYSGATDHFFNCLRWSHVFDGIEVNHLEIGTDFVKRLTEVAKDCVIQGHRLFMQGLTFTNGVGPLDFLVSLPTKALSWSTRALLETPKSAGGDLLKAAASHGFWHVCSDKEVDKNITETDIFDFLFGAYLNGDCERKLGFKCPAISDKFLENLWQAAQECQLKHTAYLKITLPQEDEEEDEEPMRFDTSEIQKYGREDRDYDNGYGSKQILYDFPDMPRFRIVHWLGPYHEIVCWFNFDEDDMGCDDSLN